MFSPGDDQDDTVFDQLRSIRPFTVDQLYLIHADVGCPPKAAISVESADANDDQKFIIPQPDEELYRNLVEYEQLKNKLVELKDDIKKLYKKTYDHVDKAWSLKEESIRKVAMCQQGKIAEATFKFNKASIDKKQLSLFSQEFSELIDLITRDYIYYSYESQVKRNKILTDLSISYQTPDLEVRKTKLKSSIVTLFEFLRHTSDNKTNVVISCRKWLRALSKRYLDGGTTQDYRFIISQLAKSSVGAADWSADLFECKPYEQVSGFESVPQYITHCSTILSELFYSLQLRIKQLTKSTAATTGNTKEDVVNPSQSDQNWSLVDPRFSCAEEVSVATSNCNLLSESDVIKFCLKIPIAQIFRAHVKKCLEITNESLMETDKNYEYVMLKLLTIGTVIIKTYQIGLETFNSIQYGSLIEYLSSQLRRTVVILSDQWSEFKQRLRGIDDALLMRLQVEYDNFMLRSILIIRELRQSGIWRHLSRIECDAELQTYDNPLGWSTDNLRPALAKLLQVTGIAAAQPQQSTEKAEAVVDESKKSSRMLRRSSTSLTYEFSTEWFKDVSEPMLWHILWQFYHNAFVSSCDYHSDYYWLKKFREKSVIFLFVNKIKDSPLGECRYLLNSITSMLLSRTKPESKLVQFIAAEIFNLTFKNQSLKEKVSRMGLISLKRCAEKFPNLISLYLSSMDEDIDENAVELIKSCSLTGWICDDNEFALLESWLIEHQLSAPKNKIARLILYKLLLNSPQSRMSNTASPGNNTSSKQATTLAKPSELRRSSINNDCFVDLKMRRKLALVLYHASTVHLPENNQFGPQSLGASVEVAFGAGLCGNSDEKEPDNLLELSVDSSYQQFYIWTWRILFALRLHILHQIEADWNDVQMRSDSGNSNKNTVTANDPFYPVPSIIDPECSALAEGIKSQNSVASFVYLLLTDVTWHSDSVDSCLVNLNILADSGHITPSLMAMKFFTICHLNDLADRLVMDKRCINYFKKIIMSNFDATRLASLILTQLDHLKQYRQLQLSYFYIKVLLDVSNIVTKQMSASWFSSNEISLEKIACILDFIARFNFTQHRVELIRKFYDCAYVIQDQQHSQSNSWFGSLMPSNSPQRHFSTNLHILARKFKKYIWLQWVTTECDALRLEKVWEDIVAYLSTNEEANLDSAIKKFCPQINPALFRSILPIYSWVDLIFDIMETDLNHPLCPLIWYNFYLNYFANSLNGVSVGVKLISQETLTRLMDRLDSLHKYHSYKQKNWSSSSALQKNPSLTQLYQAYKLWLRDTSLHDAYVDIDSLGDQYLVPLLKAVMESSNANACLHYIDLDRIESQNKSLSHVWISSTRPLLSDQKNPIEDPIIYLDNNDLDDTQGDEFMQNEPADDAASLIARSHGIQPESKAARSLDDGQQELNKALDDDFFGEKKYRTGDELISLVKEQFSIVFEESTLFQLNISELNRTKTELIELVLRLYTNKKRTFVRVAPCIEGNECAGPARIKLEAEEALMDERKSQCIQDRRGQCQELVGELLVMPRNSCVKATILIEDNTKRLIDDPMRSKMVIETLLSWLSKSENYSQLNGSFCTANHLFKTVLEILSTSDQVDAYNHSIINVCLEHPESVQILSPYLSPCSCTAECFLDLYKTICSKQMTLGPMATFVMLSKFDIKSWLNTNSNKTKKAYHELIVTTCLAFKDIGKEPDKSNELTMDLFRRHLQIELAAPIREKPDELFLVLEQFLNLMDERVLAPNLWLDFLIIIGLNHDVKQEDCFKTTSITENVARLAECQTIFDHHSLCILIQTINQYLKDRCYESKRVTLLELYHDYIEQFGVMMLSVTFMWIKSTSDAMLVDNIDPIWKQFIGMWAEWVLPQASCKNNLNYNLLVDYFVYSMQYMVHKMSDSVQSILGSLLIELASYLRKLKDNLKLELTILQRSLKNLPWSCMLATPRDLENLAILSERTNHNMSDLVSHIMLQINIKESLAMLDQESTEVSVMAQSVEHLSNIIISQYEHLQGIQLPERYLCAINTNNIPKLASSMLARAEFLDTEGDQILFKLLKHICMGQNDLNTMVGLDRSQADNQSKQTTTLTFDTIERALIYARFVSDYLVVLIRRKPTLVQQTYPKLLTTVINNSLMDLEPILRSAYLSAEQRKILYATLLKCCNSDALDGNSRLMLAKLFAESNPMKNKPSLVVDMLQSIGQFLRDPKILVNMVEALVDLYFSITGHYDEVCKCFYLSSIQIDLYLDSCIRERSPMALMIYYESQLFCTSNQQSIDCVEATPVSSLPKSNVELYRGRAQLWPSYLFWLSQLIHRLSKRPSEASLISINAHKVTTILIRLLIAFESDLEQFVLKDCLFDGNGHHSILPHSDHAGPMETMNGDNMNGLEQKNDHDQSNTANNSSILATGAASQTKSSARPTTSNLSGGHRCLLGLIKELTSFYDSFNSGGLWSYLKSSNKSEQSVKISITSLTVACFLADRSLLHLAKVTQEAPAQLKLLRDELVKSRRICLAKLESLRKSKSSMDYSQFLDSFIESVQQNIKVQYGEVVQLITTFELAH